MDQAENMNPDGIILEEQMELSPVQQTIDHQSENAPLQGLGLNISSNQEVVASNVKKTIDVTKLLIVM